MIKIYHAKSTRSMRLIWLCEELALPYEAVAIDFSPAGRAKPEWRRLSPTGKVPAISDGEYSMFESGAIVEYLLERYGRGRLRPAHGTPESGLYLQWSWFAEATFARPLGDIAQHTIVRPEAQRMPAVVDDAKLRTLVCLDALEPAVPKGQYVVNGNFTAADIMMGYTLYLARRFGVLNASNYPNVNAYLARLDTHPGFIKAQQ
jgi:glutathione S-transferase